MVSVRPSPITRLSSTARWPCSLRFVARRNVAHLNLKQSGRTGRGYRRWLTFIAVLAAASLAAVSAQAQSTWNNTGTDVWNTPSNWSTDTVPTTTAIFGTSSQNSVTFNAAPPAIDTIQINTGSSSYTFNLSGQTLTLNLAGSGIVDNSSSAISFSNGTIAGVGGIQLGTGAGTLTLSTTSTYSGATTKLIPAGRRPSPAIRPTMRP